MVYYYFQIDKHLEEVARGTGFHNICQSLFLALNAETRMCIVAKIDPWYTVCRCLSSLYISESKAGKRELIVINECQIPLLLT